MKSAALKSVLALIALALFLVVGREYAGELPRIWQASFVGIGAIAVIHSVTLWLNGQAIAVGLRAFRCQETQRTQVVEGSRAGEAKAGTYFSLSVLGSYANLLLPRSGIATTAAFLKCNCGVGLADFGAVTFYNGILFVFSGSALALLTLHLYLGREWQNEVLLFAVLYSLFLASALASTFDWKKLRLGRSGSRVPSWIERPFNKLQYASANLVQSRFSGELIVIQFAMAGLRALRLGVACWALGVAVDPLGVLLASALGDVIFVFAITPAALGFRELAIAFSASAMGITPETALSIAVFDRLVFSGTVVLLAQGLIAFAIGKPTAKPHKKAESLAQ